MLLQWYDNMWKRLKASLRTVSECSMKLFSSRSENRWSKWNWRVAMTDGPLRVRFWQAGRANSTCSHKKSRPISSKYRKPCVCSQSNKIIEIVLIEHWSWNIASNIQARTAFLREIRLDSDYRLKNKDEFVVTPDLGYGIAKSVSNEW